MTCSTKLSLQLVLKMGACQAHLRGQVVKAPPLIYYIYKRGIHGKICLTCQY
jgi:hypothetical protein